MDDERIFAIYEAITRGIMTADEIFEMTRIDRWFLVQAEPAGRDGKGAQNRRAG